MQVNHISQGHTFLVLTDAFSKFSQAFVKPNQKALTMAKIIVDKYICGSPAEIYSDKG